MNELTIINRDGKLLADSREIAERVGKDHKNLLRDIATYIDAMKSGGQLKIEPSEFFIESTYKNVQNKDQPRYLITRKGCDMVANKMTGQKGVLFTAEYVTEFDRMEKQLQQPQLPQDYLSALKALVSSEEEKESLKLESKKQSQIIGELQPKANYVDTILKNPGLVTITQIAKDYGMTGNEMNKLLQSLHVQYKESGQWLLYKEHQAKGYTHSRTVEFERRDGRKDVSMNTAWTQKGRLFIYQLLKDNGIIPMIERKEV